MSVVLEKDNCKKKLKDKIKLLPKNSACQKAEETLRTYPIVKWAGGKRQLLFEIQKNMPKQFNRYFEPFIGGGAVFFETQPENAYISDVNEELVNLYSIIQNS